MTSYAYVIFDAQFNGDNVLLCNHRKKSNFVNIWGIGEGQTYPFLRTHSTGDVNKDGRVNFLDLILVLQITGYPGEVFVR